MEEQLLDKQNELVQLLDNDSCQQSLVIKQKAQPKKPLNNLNRIQRLCDEWHKLESKKPQMRVELDLSLILIREMKANYKVVRVMIYSIIIDLLIRSNNYVFLFLAILQYDKENNVLVLIIYLFIVPRVLLFLSQIKLLVKSLHKLKNQSIQAIMVLYRQNFTEFDMEIEAKNKWYDWQGSSYTYETIQLALFLITPNEFTIFQLGSTDNGLKTYIVSSFILKTIEIVTFEPVMLILLYLNQYYLDFKLGVSQGYNTFTLAMIYIDIGKYIFICAFYLTKRNYQINKLLK
ncbi:hypothetical protein pb186bvf_007148 [Paramecium bursaria]